jgi:hypothetical protein
MLILAILPCIRADDPPKLKWDISHCVSEVINPGVGVDQHSKVVVSRYYPSPMGNNWACEYKFRVLKLKIKLLQKNVKHF